MEQKLWMQWPNSSSDNPKSKTCPESYRRIGNLKWVGLSVIAFVLVVGGPVATAQQPTKVPRIGFLDASTASGSAILLEAFRQELSKLGWIEGKNISIEYQSAESKGPSRLTELAAELVRLKVDLIVVTEGTSALA